jgi:hypothetical protein
MGTKRDKGGLSEKERGGLIVGGRGAERGGQRDRETKSSTKRDRGELRDR